MVKIFGLTILNSITGGVNSIIGGVQGFLNESWKECNKTIRQYIALSKCFRTIKHGKTFGSHDTWASNITIANEVDEKFTQFKNKDNLTPCSWWRHLVHSLAESP